MKLKLVNKDFVSADCTMNCAIFQIATEYMDFIGNEQYDMYCELLKKYTEMLKDDPSKESDVRFEIDMAKTMISRFKKIKKALKYITVNKLKDLDEEAAKQIDVILKYRGMLWY